MYKIITVEYKFGRGSNEADKILDFLRDVGNTADKHPKMHYAIDQYPQKLIYHIEPGVTAVIGYYASCPAAIPDGMEFSIKLLGSEKDRNKAKPILEEVLGFEIK